MNNAMTGYTVEGATRPRPLYIRMDDVSAVIDDGPCEDGGQDDAPTGPYDLLYEEGGENLR